jgi:hypothetical protein
MSTVLTIFFQVGRGPASGNETRKLTEKLLTEKFGRQGQHFVATDETQMKHGFSINPFLIRGLRSAFAWLANGPSVARHYSAASSGDKAQTEEAQPPQHGGGRLGSLTMPPAKEVTDALAPKFSTNRSVNEYGVVGSDNAAVAVPLTRFDDWVRADVCVTPAATLSCDVSPKMWSVESAMEVKLSLEPF